MTNQQGAPEALRLAASLVTRESAMQAIGHVAIHNNYYREREAVEMLVAATPPTQAAPSVLEDAARYRHLRDVPHSEEVRSVLSLQQNAVMDKVIDKDRAAMAAKKGEAT